MVPFVKPGFSPEEMKSGFEAYLRKSFPAPPPPVAILEEAMRYSTFSDGKRLRPLLMLSTLADLGGDPQDALPFAAAVECIHCYSLIHDDLPGMDNADLRRGKLTNHVVYGEDIAILAGDGLLSLAFQLCSTATPRLKPAAQLRAINTLARLCGLEGMVSGQVADVKAQSDDLDAEMLRFIHEHKTGALIRACFEIAGQIKGLEDAAFEALANFGKAVGLVFQIQDDVLEVTQDSASLGKSNRTDLINRKLTYVSQYGVEGAKRKARSTFAQAQARFTATGIRLERTAALIGKLYPILSEATMTPA